MTERLSRDLICRSLVLMACLTVAAGVAAEPLVLQNDFVRFAFDERGAVTEVANLATGADYAAPGGERAFCEVALEDGTRLSCMRLDRDGRVLTAGFERPDVGLTFSLEERDGYFTLGLEEVRGEGVVEVRLLDLATTLPRRSLVMNSVYNDEFVVGAFALDLPVNARAVPDQAEGRQGNAVTATCYSRIAPLAGNRLAVYGCPYAEIEHLVTRIQQENGLPHPVYDGHWTKLSPDVRKSYLFLHDITEANADRAIEYALRGGFDMVMINTNAWAATGGQLEINERNFPRGMAGLNDVCDRIHSAGLKVALHSAACCAITEDDAFVTPVPAPGLLKDASATLAEAVSAEDTFLPLTAVSEEFPRELGGAGDNGLDVQIGNEIVRYASVQMDPPGLGGCTRGAYGTQASAHDAGSAVEHLRRYFGRFVYDLHSEVGRYYTGRLAEVCDTVGVDMLYLDFSKYGPDEWFYGAEIQRAIYERLENGGIFMQGGRTWHSSWHLMSRTASADGYADWRGYLNKRLNGFESDLGHRFLHLPREVGWYGLKGPYGWMPMDAFRYVRHKGLGFDAPLSLSARVEWLEEHPRAMDLLDISRRCEIAHVERHLTDEQLARARELDVDYLLEPVGNDGVRLREVSYDSVRDVTGEAGRLSMMIESDADGPVPFELDLRLVRKGGAGEAYDDVVAEIEDFESIARFREAWVRDGCSHEWRAGEGRTGAQCLEYEISNTSNTPNGYSGIQIDFEEPISVGEHAAVGFWVRGDRKGEWIKFQLRDADGNLAVYPVLVDFEGWAYLEIEQPDPFRDLDYSRITGMIVYYQQVPADTTCTIALDGIRALASVSSTGLPGAEMTLRGESVGLPGSRARWQTIVLSPDGSSHLLGEGGVHLADAPRTDVGNRLLPGENDIELTYDRSAGACDFEVRLMRVLE